MTMTMPSSSASLSAKITMADGVPYRLREVQGSGQCRKTFSFVPGQLPRRPIRPTWVQAFQSIVLPIGFPDTVSPDYIPFQTWDTAQALCSYLRSLLCQQSILLGLGVGKAEATVSSAALSWMFLNGMSMLGGILFTFHSSADFGSDPKRWRLFADCINDVGLTLTMAAPICGPLFLFVASAGSVCSAICGVAAGATRATITQHFAKHRSNSAVIADIYAKEGVQETMVTLTGLLLGTAISRLMQDAPVLQWSFFILLTILHVITNYWAVTSLRLTTLNHQRTSLLCRHYSRCASILTPGQVAEKENVWGPYVPPFLIRMGLPLHDCIKDQTDLEWFLRQDIETNFAIRTVDKCVQVLLRESASSEDILNAYFRAYFLSRSLQNSCEQFEDFCMKLDKQGWHRQDVSFDIDEGWRCPILTDQSIKNR